jgi:hypothetical protein
MDDEHDGTAPDPTGFAGTTLRIVVDGPDGAGKTSVVQQLASSNGTAIEVVGAGGGGARFEWLAYEAGWFEGHPLRL